MKIRLNKFLAQCGLGSRRSCDQLIQAGKIAVNGKTITALGCIIDDAKDKVTYRDKLLSREEQKVYIALHKPPGYVTTVKDERGRKTVTELINIEERVFPIGRLDKDSEGLLLLTNDGNLCYRLTHPKFVVDKEYKVHLDRQITDSDIKKLEQGLMIETGMTAPCKIKRLSTDRMNKTLLVIIHEGKKRQIRRMFEALGYSVKRLIRVKFANLTLKNLPSGKWRFLTEKEITKLHKIVYHF